MSVVGSISIRDNASSVLKSIRQEQTALRKDAAETRKELQRAWDKTYTAKINTESATRKTDGLTGKVKQLGKTVISPVIKAKDAASATITKVSNGIKTVGKKVATPVIKIKDSATSKVKSIKNALTGVAKKVTTPVIKLKDAITSKATKITGKLKALGGKIFSPIVKLKDATASGISSISGKLKTLAATVAIPVTIVATAVVGGAVTEGAALEQSIGGVETLFKENASVVKANADAAFKTAGLSANEYMSQVTSFSASLLSSLGGDTAKAAEVADMAMIDMADNANKFGTDMESIQNAYQGFAKQNYTMLDNLKLGYGGTQEEMQRLLQDASKISGVKYDMSIFPFIDSTSTSTETNDELPMLKEYAYDFEKNELLLDEGGRTYMVEGNEALRIWIFKALFTERCHYTAYSFAFGSEIQDQVIGHSMNVEIVKLEIERFIIEALMVNPYIKRLDNFVFENTSTGMTVSFDCTGIYGSNTILVPVREVRV